MLTIIAPKHIGYLDDLISSYASFFWRNFSVELESFLKEIFKNCNNVYSYLMSICYECNTEKIFQYKIT